jgi:hypothetical protein
MQEIAEMPMRGALAVGSLVTGVGYLGSKVAISVGAITADSLVPLFALAGGVAAGVVCVWKMPQEANLKSLIRSHSLQIAAYEQRIDDLEQSRDRDRESFDKALEVEREKLRICRETLTDLSLKVRVLEREAAQGVHKPTRDLPAV